MAELILTAERREELAVLLDDQDRLRGEFPTVAQYLDTASVLPGTGDDRADGAFDLRLVHYMTGGRGVSANPYWEIVEGSVSDRGERRVVDGGCAKGSARLGFAQTVLQGAYAYAIPAPETIGWIAGLCRGRRVVELGAGRGYWAAQLAAAGVAVAAFDAEPPDRVENLSFRATPDQPDVWYPVDGLDRLGRTGPDDVLFLCWPPGWGNPMASLALAEFESTGGHTLVYIGEPKGGKTADDAFFDGLARRWELVAEDSDFVSWWNLADRAQYWRLR